MMTGGWYTYMAWAAFCSLGVLLALVGEYRSNPVLGAIGKLIAATAYIAAALSLGATDTDYGRLLLLGMAFCWLGDMFLVSEKDQRLFLAGLASFLLGHVVYIGAFAVRGFSQPTLLMAALVMVIFAWRVGRWLQPHVKDRMRLPVLLYIIAISAMMAMAVATWSEKAGISLLLGGFLFVISDLFVARNRFIAPGIINRAWGLPVYFAAQLLLAASVGV